MGTSFLQALTTVGHLVPIELTGGACALRAVSREQSQRGGKAPPRLTHRLIAQAAEAQGHARSTEISRLGGCKRATMNSGRLNRPLRGGILPTDAIAQFNCLFSLLRRASRRS